MPREELEERGDVANSDPAPEAAYVIEDLLGLLKGTNISELDLEWKGFHVHIRREPTLDAEIESGLATPSEAHDVPQREDGMVVVPSGYVGTFRRDRDAHLPEIGDDVRAGTKIAEIEVLRVRNPVSSPVDGILSAFLVEDEAAVEYGQPLALLKPPHPRGGPADER